MQNGKLMDKWLDFAQNGQASFIQHCGQNINLQMVSIFVNNKKRSSCTMANANLKNTGDLLLSKADIQRM